MVGSNSLELPEIRKIAYYSYHITGTMLVFQTHTKQMHGFCNQQPTSQSYPTASEVTKTSSMLLLSTMILLNLNLLL